MMRNFFEDIVDFATIIFCSIVMGFAFIGKIICYIATGIAAIIAAIAVNIVWPILKVVLMILATIICLPILPIILIFGHDWSFNRSYTTR